MDTYIKNARIVTESGVFDGGVAIKDGRISLIVDGDQAISADNVIDAAGHYVLPGIIDAHAHFSHPGREFEGYATGSRAAAAGGVTTVIDMPLNDLPPMATAAAHTAKRDMVKDLAVVDYAFWGGLIDDNLEHLDDLNDKGVAAFKAFMRTAKDYPKVNDDLLFAGLRKMSEFGNMVGVHAENDTVISHLEAHFKSIGRHDRAAWNDSHPCESELEAINRAIFWSKSTGGSLYICHISFAEGVDAVRQAVLQGVDVYAETCAHHLFFDMDDYLRVGPRLRAAPPIRPRPQVEELWNRVLRGNVDVIASDHSPFLPESYRAGENSPWEGTGGVAGIQSILPAMMTEGVHKRGMPWELLVRMMSANPARIFGLYPRKGALLPGSDADLVIVDPDKTWTLEEDDLFYRYKQSPYVGRSFQGSVERTIVRGETVYLKGEILGTPGHGQLVTRRKSGRQAA
jgi:allantoinase